MIVEFDMPEGGGREPVADKIQDIVNDAIPGARASVTWTQEATEDYSKAVCG